ncbi:GNAT family N-acetyltransferase [Odoribacter splanchnicus]|jgi:butyryltransferase|uniref:GNAT family N-acetyltransferase n=1 Tax=Odoribacter splanchnicus TaxID=28118 RepID=UPI000E4DE725|nr:GNAT family N-acetyltransferase [Odoribacter splanchnicus]NUN81331.1 GNAT family N-acetyltransferase [Odoribacter splanchnicus]RHL78853.1 N-acetyltransferase [Odoribacter splanchnicus]
MKLDSDFTYEKYGLQLRFVNEDDAEFIIKLRTDPKLGKFIHSTSSDIEEQKKWIRAYKKREQAGTDYYFIFFKDGVPVGLNRLYWIKEDSYTSGSWVFSPDAPFECAIAAALIVRIIAFEILGKKVENALDGCHKDNVKVLRFNKMIGLEITGTIQDVKGEYYTGVLTKENFEKNRKKLERLLQLI